jgi:hypothetical protein
MRELRLGKKFDKASEVLKELENESKDKDGKPKPSIMVVKEKNFLLQDQEKYREAALGWDGIMKQLKQKVNQDPLAKDLYWEAYFELVVCVYKDALKKPDEKKKVEAIQKAAGFITKLESSQPDMGGEASKKRFHDLLAAEAPLKAQYDELKKNNK